MVVKNVHDARTPIDRGFDALIGYEIRRLNNHLPKRRKDLKELLNQKNDSTVAAVDGTELLLRRKELQELANIVPIEYHQKLRLPFIILRQMEMGQSTFSVVGDQLEAFTIQKILGRTTDSFHQMYQHKEQFLLYRPEVSELVGKFHSLVVIWFGVPQELSDYDRKRI